MHCRVGSPLTLHSPFLHFCGPTLPMGNGLIAIDGVALAPRPPTAADALHRNRLMSEHVATMVQRSRSATESRGDRSNCCVTMVGMSRGPTRRGVQARRPGRNPAAGVVRNRSPGRPAGTPLISVSSMSRWRVCFALRCTTNTTRCCTSWPWRAPRSLAWPDTDTRLSTPHPPAQAPSCTASFAAPLHPHRASPISAANAPAVASPDETG